MTPRAALLLSVSLLVAGCDSASVYEECGNPEKIGSGEPRCYPSWYGQENERAREAAGFVSLGTERQENVIVAMDGASTTTDTGGFYRFRDTPFRYDVAARLEHDIVAFNSAAARFLDLAVERETPIRAFTSKVILSVPGAPRPGHRLAFFASGTDIVGLSGEAASDLTIASRTFANTAAVVHVVEYPEAMGLAGAVAKGKTELTVTSGTTTTATVELEPVEERKETLFETDAAVPVPPGFVIPEIELILDFGTRLSEAVVRTVTLGERLELPVMDAAGWTARTKATRADGATASIGRRPFAPGDTTGLAFYAPPTADGNEGDVLLATSAQGKGVFEHTLEPLDTASGERVIHLFSAARYAKVPDLTRLALAPARGEYRWTVRVFPDFAFVEAMSGLDNRLYRSSSTSSPRTIVLP